MGNLTDSPTVFGDVARSLNTPFEVSATSPALVIYTLQLEVEAPLLSDQSADVLLKIDGFATPETVLGGGHLDSSQLAGLSLVSLETQTVVTVVGWVSPGFNVLLDTSNSNGGSVTLLHTCEIVFGS